MFCRVHEGNAGMRKVCRYAKDNCRENGDEFFFIIRKLKETSGASYSQAGFPTPKGLGDLQRISESVSLKNGARSMVHTSIQSGLPAKSWVISGNICTLPHSSSSLSSSFHRKKTAATGRITRVGL